MDSGHTTFTQENIIWWWICAAFLVSVGRVPECRIGIEQALFSSRSWGTVKADKLHANKGLKIERKKIKNQIKIKLLNFLWGQGKERG